MPDTHTPTPLAATREEPTMTDAEILAAEIRGWRQQAAQYAATHDAHTPAVVLLQDAALLLDALTDLSGERLAASRLDGEGEDVLDYRIATGCAHALHEACEHCSCPTCGTRAVKVYDPEQEDAPPMWMPASVVVPAVLRAPSTAEGGADPARILAGEASAEAGRVRPLSEALDTLRAQTEGGASDA